MVACAVAPDDGLDGSLDRFRAASLGAQRTHMWQASARTTCRDMRNLRVELRNACALQRTAWADMWHPQGALGES